MKIELVDIYKAKSKNKNFIGSAHVYLCDIEMDLRGIAIFKTPKGYLIRLPDRFSVDENTNKPVRYPIIGFTNKAKQIEIIKEINRLVTNELKGKKCLV